MRYTSYRDWLPLLFLLLLVSCREEEPIPQPQQGGIIFTSKSDTILAGKFTFSLPEAAVTGETEIGIEEEAHCNFTYPSDEIYFFKCIFSLTPASLTFITPVVLSVTEDRYWLRALNELGLIQDFPLTQLRLYQVDIATGHSTELPNATVQINANKVTVSAAISRLGYYQLGVRRSAIQFFGGKMEAQLTGGLTKTITIESNKTGSGGALQTTQYLTGTPMTAITLVADPGNPKESTAIKIITTASVQQAASIINENGENEVLIVFFENGERFDIKSIEGKAANIQFTSYEQVGGIVEGSYQTEGKVLQTGQLVSIHIVYKVRRVT